MPTKTVIKNGRPVIVPRTSPSALQTYRSASPAPTAAPVVMRSAAPVQRIASAPAPRPGAAAKTNTGFINYGRLQAGRAAKVPTGWLGQVAAQVTKAAPALAAYQSTTPDYEFQGGGAIGSNVGIAQTGDWGLDAAALAQVDLIKSWGESNMAAVGESEIGRGMGRSGNYDAARAVEMDKSRMEATSQMANAAAEAGRINSGIVQSNAANQLQREQANQSALLSRDQIQSGYRTDMEAGALAAWNANTDARLAYSNLDENARQFNNQLAQTMTEANRSYQGQQQGFNEGMREFNNTESRLRTDGTRGYQQGRMDYTEGIRQFNANDALARTNSNRDYQTSINQIIEQARQADNTLGYNYASGNADRAENRRQYDTTAKYQSIIDAAKASAQGGDVSYAESTARANSMNSAIAKYNDPVAGQQLRDQYKSIDAYLTAVYGIKTSGGVPAKSTSAGGMGGY